MSGELARPPFELPSLPPALPGTPQPPRLSDASIQQPLSCPPPANPEREPSGVLRRAQPRAVSRAALRLGAHVPQSTRVCRLTFVLMASVNGNELRQADACAGVTTARRRNLGQLSSCRADLLPARPARGRRDVHACPAIAAHGSVPPLVACRRSMSGSGKVSVLRQGLVGSIL